MSVRAKFANCFRYNTNTYYWTPFSFFAIGVIFFDEPLLDTVGRSQVAVPDDSLLGPGFADKFTIIVHYL
jgi:hypothetical protein